MLSLAALGVALFLLWLVARRANELCAVRLSGGEATLVRGRAPRRLLADVAEIAARAPTVSMEFSVVNEGGAPRLLVRSGAAPETIVQQLRNVAGQHQLVHFRTGVSRR
ncbi:MAG TPA: DUF3634 family protein [Polyangiaceae bacterium]|nr:DUF3634 family protein [Polyangiaceae bacterium]